MNRKLLIINMACKLFVILIAAFVAGAAKTRGITMMALGVAMGVSLSALIAVCLAAWQAVKESEVNTNPYKL